MSDEKTAVADSSSAAVAEISSLNSDQYTHWRKTGELPETTQPDPSPETSSEASSGAAAQTADEPAPASQPETTEEAPKPEKAKGPRRHVTAEERKAQLKAEIADLLKQRDALKAPPQAETRAESAPAKPQQPAYTRPKPKADDVDDSGKARYATYDDYVEAVADWKAEQRIAQVEQARQQQQQMNAMAEKLAESKQRYPDLEQHIVPVANALFNDQSIPLAVKGYIDSSPVLVDLLYVMGSDQKELAEFQQLARTNSYAAMRKLAVLESLVQQELSSGKAQADVGRNERGQFTTAAKPPEKKITSAPPPPAELGGKGTPPADATETALESGNFRAYRAAANAKDLARSKGKR